MSRMTDNDKNWGPFTFGPWTKTFSIMWKTSGEVEDQPEREFNDIRLIAFGWAIQLRLPAIIKPWKEKVNAVSWDAATIERLGRDWYWNVFPREYGFSLSDMGNGYDFLSVYFGRQTHDSSTTQSWCTHLPWKQWDCVRSSIYSPDGTHFATEEKGKFFEFCRIKDTCPASHFGFEDYDGEMIVATCIIEEREWHRGYKPFRWLKYFYRPKIRRSLDLRFSAEVGPEKGSWKGGTIGHGIEMEVGETPEQAFCRYCAQEHSRKGRYFKLRFIGSCAAPPDKEITPNDKVNAQSAP